jgi:RimJ/RimL family protein N-acetyltransferase
VALLHTDRLSLRELGDADADFILRLLNEPSFLRFIGDRGVRTAADARRYLLEGPITSYARNGFGLHLVELGDATPIGICGLLWRDTLDAPDIGFAFLPEYWGRGYALEAASAVLAYAREVLRLARVVAVVSPDNDRSIGVLGKLGLQFERMITWPGEATELKLYGTP